MLVFSFKKFDELSFRSTVGSINCLSINSRFTESNMLYYKKEQLTPAFTTSTYKSIKATNEALKTSQHETTLKH